MIIMTKGIVKIKKNRAFVEQQNGEVEVASGQYVYLKVENCWIPVVVRYSARRKKWYFKYLEEIPVFLSQKFIMQLLDSALFGSFLFFTLRSIRRSRKQSADQRQTENKKKRIKIWMTGMIFMIHRKPGFLNVKFVDKDFLCLKFSIANGIFRVNGKDWFLDFQIHHLRRPQSLLR